MSRIGKMPIDLPEGVKVDIAGRNVSVSGEKGKLNQSFNPDMVIRQDNGRLVDWSEPGLYEEAPDPRRWLSSRSGRGQTCTQRWLLTSSQD